MISRFSISATLLGFGIVALSFSATTTQAATLIYSDSFDNDGLATNTGVGGGMNERDLRGGHHNWTDDGNLQFNTTGNTNFQNRVVGYTQNTFSSLDGFELEVDLFQTNYGGASLLAFGLVSTDTNLGTYSGFNPFSDASVYGFGATNDNGNLRFGDGTTSTIIDDDANFPLNAVQNVVIRFADNKSGGANWSWSRGGINLGSGTVPAFDFTKSFHFVAYGQDDQGNKRFESVQLTAIPEPGRTALFGLGLLGFLLRRRR